MRMEICFIPLPPPHLSCMLCFSFPSCLLWWSTLPYPTPSLPLKKKRKQKGSLLAAKFNMHLVICCGSFWRYTLCILSVNKKGTTHHTTNHSGRVRTLPWKQRTPFVELYDELLLHTISLTFLKFQLRISNHRHMEYLRILNLVN